jgi:hypothetical protein
MLACEHRWRVRVLPVQARRKGDLASSASVKAEAWWSLPQAEQAKVLPLMMARRLLSEIFRLVLWVPVERFGMS